MKVKSILVLTLAALTLIAAASGCSNKQETESSAEATAAHEAPVAKANTDAVLAAPPGSIRGSVIETMDSGGYTYVLVESGSEQHWAAAPQFAVSTGDIATFSTAMPMRNYKSSTLDRTFEIVYFAGAIAVGDQAAAAQASKPAGMPAGMPKPKVSSGDIDLSGIKRAENGMTVAQVWAGKGPLAGSEVTVRGKVVKYNGGIMGRNWLHIQDGTGGPGTNDLTVTTDASAKVGETVLISGILGSNVDFGSGYSYEVIVEQAKITVE